MPKVTIGVPVYNGAAQLSECLDDLLAQSCRELEIVVSDNGSDDATPEIVSSYARRDSRITHVRHEATLPVMENFLGLRDRAQTPYFMWRAHDDLSSDGFVEALVGLLDARAETQLAVSSINREYAGPKPSRFLPYPANDSGGRLPRILAQLFKGRGSWFYGLWRTGSCRIIVDRVLGDFPEPWAADYLTNAYVAFEDGIRGTRAARFRQRNLGGSYSAGHAKPLAEMQKTNREFLRCARGALQAAPLGALEKQVLAAVLPAATRRACYSGRRLLKVRLAGR